MIAHRGSCSWIGAGLQHSRSRSHFLLLATICPKRFSVCSSGVAVCSFDREFDNAFSARFAPKHPFNKPYIERFSRCAPNRPFNKPYLDRFSRCPPKLHFNKSSRDHFSPFRPAFDFREPSRNHFLQSDTTSSRPANPECPICDLPGVSACQCCAEIFCERHIYTCSACCVDLCGSCLDAHSLESHRTSATPCYDRTAPSLESHRTAAAQRSDSIDRFVAANHCDSCDRTAVPERCDSVDRSAHPAPAQLLFREYENLSLSPTRSFAPGESTFVSLAQSSPADTVSPDLPRKFLAPSAEATR